MTPQQIERYARHLVLKEVGGAGQQALLGAKIAIVGAGGLGGPAGLYLAAAGVGHITLVDDDRVDLSNLQRQVQFETGDVGALKTDAMANRLSDMNPDIKVRSVCERIEPESAIEHLQGHDLILDGTDSFKTRFAVNHAALALGVPLVSGAIGRFDGQVGVFAASATDPCYRCWVPVKPDRPETCSEVGVIGALAGIVGSMMALEAIKYITGAGETLRGRLWIFDGLSFDSRTIGLIKDPDCPACRL